MYHKFVVDRLDHDLLWMILADVETELQLLLAPVRILEEEGMIPYGVTRYVQFKVSIPSMQKQFTLFGHYLYERGIEVVKPVAVIPEAARGQEVAGVAGAGTRRFRFRFNSQFFARSNI